MGEGTVELPVIDKRSRPAEEAPGAEETDGLDAAPVLPRQRTSSEEITPAAATSANGQPGGAEHAVPVVIPPRPAPTAVLPYVGSTTSKRTRPLRAWMITAPVDAAAMLAPLLITTQYWKGTGFLAGLTVVIFAAGGLYNARRHVSILDELPSLCGRLLASAAIVAIISALRHESVEYVAGFMRAVAVAGGLVIVGRILTRSFTTLARKQRWVEHNAIIIGAGPVAVELARLLRRYPRYGLRFTGLVDTEPSADASALPLLCTLDELDTMIPTVEADVLLLADTTSPEPRLMEVLRRPACAGCDLWVVPRLWGSHAQGRISDHIGAIPVVQARHMMLSGPRRVAKRASDIVFAGLALAVLSPVFLLCAIATFFDGGRGIFFRQERIGQGGKPFQVIKFRTMRPLDEHESQTNWSIAGDRRIGPIGRFMRRTSLDELPQLWNILRGDMTVVGPRPERPYFVEKFSAEHPDYAMRHRVPVGLTGLAQVSGLRGDTPISDRARFDNYYIENWSLWLDMKVLLRTIAEVFRGGGR
ncbi:exopolysaccharide biosynthesis polyprenyl glycosylphosphotransferase [Phytohabitans flavus]|uniref:exopolysaccharide biosynthesis polyprenyl glycosylphosphotransferase n=1 Tax=Phytohabitans flavus TaxID=1076124 RepID=UPI001E5D3E24|nr:exopolysaccharide biosynthesis polyprenyl glycosylphosphotransferase [Phytohabitans flavus]